MRAWLLIAALALSAGCGPKPKPGESCNVAASVTECAENGRGLKCREGKWREECSRCMDEDGNEACIVDICIADDPSLCNVSR